MQHFFASNWNYRGVNQTDRVVVPHRKDNRGIMQSRAAPHDIYGDIVETDCGG